MNFHASPESRFSRIVRGTLGWTGIVAPVVGLAGMFFGGAAFWIAILIVGLAAPQLGIIIHLAATRTLSPKQKAAWRLRMFRPWQLNWTRWFVMLEYLLSANIQTTDDE